MKNDDQMYQSVLSRREEYRQTAEKRRRTIRRITPVLACACLAVVLGLGYRNHFRNIPEIPKLPDSTQESTTEPFSEATSTEAESAQTEPVSTTVPAESTETDPPTTEETQLPTDATEPETSGESAPESSAGESQQEQPHTDPPANSQNMPDTQPPTEPTVQPTVQATTGEDTVTHEATVVPEGSDTVFDEPPPHLLYVYACFGEEQRIYQATGLEVSEKEIGDCIGEAEVIDRRDSSHRLTVKIYLVGERSAEECIAVYLPEEGFYLYQINADTNLPEYLQRS